jgi:hypothetical protein
MWPSRPGVFSRLSDAWYHVTTAALAFWRLLRIKQEEVDAFLDSYEVFAQESCVDGDKSEEHVVAYYNVRAASREERRRRPGMH